MDSAHPGYIPVDSLPFFKNQDCDVKWIAENPNTVAAMVNHLASVGDTIDIFAANRRLVDEKHDRVFAEFMRKNLSFFCNAISTSVVEKFDQTQVPNWDNVDYDDVRNLIHHEISRKIDMREPGAWLSADCELAEALMDHVAARLRDGMKWLAFEADDGNSLPDYHRTLAHTIELSIKKILPK